MDSPAEKLDSNSLLVPPGEGFDLLTLMTARAGMGLVTSFEEMEKKNSGLVILLGNQRPPFGWSEMENWVRRGGVLLVAFDEAPPRFIQNRFERLTGFQWSNLRLKHVGEKGVNLLPQRSFAQIQKLVPFDWSLIGKGEAPSFLSKPKGMGHTNSPSFLLPMEGAETGGEVFARLPNAVELDLGPGVSMRLPAFSADFGVVANVGRGKVIQMADPDVFSNQMLELEGNFQFTWSILQKVKKEKAISPDDFPVMILGQRVESDVYTLPAPPVPLPELDLFQLASVATQALAEKLPSLENQGGIFERLSNRLSSRMNRTFWAGLSAGVLALLGFWFLFGQRGANRARKLAAQTTQETMVKFREMAAKKKPGIRPDDSGSALAFWVNSKSAADIPLWELGRISTGLGKRFNSDQRNSKQIMVSNGECRKAAARLVNWIALGGIFAKTKSISRAIETVAKEKMTGHFHSASGKLPKKHP